MRAVNFDEKKTTKNSFLLKFYLCSRAQKKKKKTDDIQSDVSIFTARCCFHEVYFHLFDVRNSIFK